MLTSSGSALKASRNELSMTGSPRASRSGMPWPFRNTITERPTGAPQSSSVISVPVALNHTMSRSRSPSAGRPAEHRVGPAELRHRAGEGGQVAELLGPFPVHPGDRVVLAVGVVVAALGAADLVPAQQHGHALGQQQRADQVAPLAGPQVVDGRVVGRALGPAVPGPVVVGAVPVVLAVGLVVLVVVGDQVVDGEAVVRGDEVDRRGRAPAVVLVQVGRAGDTGRELAQRAGLAAPEVPDR